MQKWMFSCLSCCLTLAIHVDAAISWTASTNLSEPHNNALSPQVCMTPEGYACAIWSRFDGANFVVQTSAAPVGGAWSSPFRLSKINQNAFFPVIAHDRQGDINSLWSRFNGTNYVIQADYKPSRRNWTDPVTISGTSQRNQNASTPQIGIEPKGRHLAIWHKHNGISNVIQCAQKKPNGDWDKPVTITKGSSWGLGDMNPQIAVDDFGNAYTIWVNESTQTIRGSMKPAKGNWGDPVDISTSGQGVSSPCIAVDGQGNVTALWTQWDGENFIVMTACRTLKSSFSSPLNLSEEGQNALQPALAVDAIGNKIAVWHRYDGTNTIVQAAVQSAGSTWSNPIDISLSGQDASDPQVKVNSTGKAIAVWKRSDGDNFIVQASEFSVYANHWSEPASLSAPGYDAMTPQLAISNKGHVVVVWQRSDGANSIIQGSFGINNN